MDATKLRQLVFVGVGATLLDAVLTYHALRHTGLAELNPLAAHGMQRFGIGPLIALDIVIRIGIVAAFAGIVRAAVHPLARTAAGVAFTGLATWWTLIAVSNVFVLAASHT